MCYIVTMCHQWFCMNKWLSSKYTLVENTIIEIYSRISSRSRWISFSFEFFSFEFSRRSAKHTIQASSRSWQSPHPWALQILGRYNWIHCGPCMCYIFEKSLVQDPQKHIFLRRPWYKNLKNNVPGCLTCKYTNIQIQIHKDSFLNNPVFFLIAYLGLLHIIHSTPQPNPHVWMEEMFGDMVVQHQYTSQFWRKTRHFLTFPLQIETVENVKSLNVNCHFCQGDRTVLVWQSGINIRNINLKTRTYFESICLKAPVWFSKLELESLDSFKLFKLFAKQIEDWQDHQYRPSLQENLASVISRRLFRIRAAAMLALDTALGSPPPINCAADKAHFLPPRGCGSITGTFSHFPWKTQKGWLVEHMTISMAVR